MASPNMRARNARLDGLQPNVITEVEHPGTNRWARRHFVTREKKIVNTVQHPNWTERFREEYRIRRWNAMHGVNQ
jgi:hypothetical protein